MKQQSISRNSRIVLNGFLNLTDNEKRQIINEIIGYRQLTHEEQTVNRTQSRAEMSRDTEPILPHCPCCGR
jgi:hypothetical protein